MAVAYRLLDPFFSSWWRKPHQVDAIFHSTTQKKLTDWMQNKGIFFTHAPSGALSLSVPILYSYSENIEKIKSFVSKVIFLQGAAPFDSSLPKDILSLIFAYKGEEWLQLAKMQGKFIFTHLDKTASSYLFTSSIPLGVTLKHSYRKEIPRYQGRVTMSVEKLLDRGGISRQKGIVIVSKCSEKKSRERTRHGPFYEVEIELMRAKYLCKHCDCLHLFSRERDSILAINCRLTVVIGKKGNLQGHWRVYSSKIEKNQLAVLSINSYLRKNHFDYLISATSSEG